MSVIGLRCLFLAGRLRSSLRRSDVLYPGYMYATLHRSISIVRFFTHSRRARRMAIVIPDAVRMHGPPAPALHERINKTPTSRTTSDRITNQRIRRSEATAASPGNLLVNDFSPLDRVGRGRQFLDHAGR